MELQDYDTIMLDEITKIEINNLFRLEEQKSLPYEKFDNTWVSVTIEMNLNLMHYERNVYTIFDMLSDVGGLSGLFVSCFAMFAGVWNYNSFDNFMVSRLFKIKKPKEEIEEDMGFYSQSDYIKIGRCPFFMEYLQSWLPKCCHCFCLKRNRRQIAMQQAREKLDKEINIIEMVKAWRYFEKAIRFLLPLK